MHTPIEIMGWNFYMMDLFMNGRLEYCLYIYRKTGDNKIQVLDKDFKPQELEVGEGLYKAKPTLVLEEMFIQGIFEAMWEIGARPKNRDFKNEIELKEKELDATKDHLNDMRTIAFKKLGIEEDKKDNSKNA